MTSSAQAKSGILCSVMPGARMFRMVVMKLIAPEDRAGAGQVQGEDREVDGRAGMAGGRERRIDGPAGAGAGRAGRALDEQRAEQAAEARHRQPERDVVHARERHVGRADHEGHEPVAEAADQRRHHHEEHHDEAMAGDEHVVGRRDWRSTAGRALPSPSGCRRRGTRRSCRRRRRRAGRACRCPCGSSTGTSGRRTTACGRGPRGPRHGLRL